MSILHPSECHMIEAYTDYPFIELGDVGGKDAPIRRVKVRLLWVDSNPNPFIMKYITDRPEQLFGKNK